MFYDVRSQMRIIDHQIYICRIKPPSDAVMCSIEKTWLSHLRVTFFFIKKRTRFSKMRGCNIPR